MLKISFFIKKNNTHKTNLNKKHIIEKILFWFLIETLLTIDYFLVIYLLKVMEI